MQTTLSGRALWAHTNLFSTPEIHGISFVRNRHWYRGVWFMHHTPKCAFFTWLAILNHLTTGDRMLTWNTSVNSSCVFCNQLETRNHLFFSCPFTSAVWTQLMCGLLGARFTTNWEDRMALAICNSQDMLTTFLTRYGLQVSLHSLCKKETTGVMALLQPRSPPLSLCLIGIFETDVAPSD